MHRQYGLSSIVWRAIVSTGVAGFIFAKLSAVAHADGTVIDTHSSWDGKQSVTLFGCPDTTTYGQLITVPKGMHHLNKFTFWWRSMSGGSMVVRAEVYRLGGLSHYQSSPRTISFADSAFHRVTFIPATGVKVQQGYSYIVFVSIDKDYEQCTQGYTLAWGSVSDSAYANGTFLYQNNGGDETQWTAGAWHQFGVDLAFRAYFSP